MKDKNGVTAAAVARIETRPRIARQSIRPTYDSRTDGPQFMVTVWVGDKMVTDHQPIDDPFANTTVRISWKDALRLLWQRGRISVLVGIDGATSTIVEDVLELDANYKGWPNSTRRRGCDAEIQSALESLASE